MRSELFWLLSLCGFAALSLVCGLLAWPQLSAAWPSIEEKIDRFRRQPPLAKVVLLVFIVGFIAYGSTKTNQVDQTSGTNIVEIVEGGTNEIVRLFGLFDCSSEEVRLSVTPEDIARGWQLWEVRTNHDVCYTMPEGATMATNWWIRGAFEDCSIVRLGDCSIGGGVSQSNNLNNPNNQAMSFPFGTNEYDSVWAFTWGKLRFVLGDGETEIAAVGAPMSAVPHCSRLWSVADTNGSRLVTWENFALNRDTNTPVNAQIELRASGDFVTRSNEVEAVYRYIDDFDWDGDGILNINDGAPCWFDGDYAGQDEWTREYVDECVGSGLENGYYKLTAIFPSGYFRRTQLCVGDERIVVAEPGEYVFLLEKGIEYPIEMEPFVDGVLFDAVDDIPDEDGLMMPLTLGQGRREGKWSRDEGRLVLDPPRLGVAGCVMWTPKLCVSPDGWNPSVADPSEVFTAVLFDRTDWMTEPSYRWSGVSGLVSVDSPNAISTRMTWEAGPPASVWARLVVSFGDVQLESDLSVEYENEDEWRGTFAFSVDSLPDTLFVNNDNDLGGAAPDMNSPQPYDDDIPCAEIRIASTHPTNGTIRVDNLTGFIGDVYDGYLMQDIVFSGQTWPVSDSTEHTEMLYFNAMEKSAGFETSQIKVRWIPEVGPERTYTRRFTVVEPVAEPICTEMKTVTVDGETVNLVYNPCGVAVGRDAYFKIKVKPDAYPDSMIEWKASGDGAVSFVGAGCGREVCVRGVTPGDVTLSAKLGTCRSTPPSFTFRVVTNRTVKLSAWIIADKDGRLARTAESVHDMVKTVNDIYAQVGVTFDLGDRIAVTNIPAAYDILWEGATNTMWNFDRLTELASNTGGLELYFVSRIQKISGESARRTIGGHCDSGIVIAAAGQGVTLAHELGHAFGMADIYRADQNEVLMEGATRIAFQLWDWNNGCAANMAGCERYYATGTKHREIIGRMLMDGYKFNSVSNGVDITFGPVHGLDAAGAEDECNTGFFANPGHVDNPVHR